MMKEWNGAGRKNHECRNIGRSHFLSEKRPPVPMTLDFILDGETFPTTKKVVVNKCTLFELHPGLFKSEFYRVQSPVSKDLFRVFVDCLESGEKIQVTEENVRDLSLLGQEFGLESLLEDCCLVRSEGSIDVAPDSSPESLTAVRLALLERTLVAQARRIRQQDGELQRFTKIDIELSKLRSEIQKCQTNASSNDQGKLSTLEEEQRSMKKKQDDFSQSINREVKSLQERLQQEVIAIKELLTDAREVGIPAKHHEYNEIPIPYKPSAPFEGIISLLARNCTGNVHDKHAINIYSSSIWHDEPRWHPKNVTEYGKKSGFASKKEQCPWIAFDFKRFRVRVDHYSLTSCDGGVNWAHPKSWVLEGSEDGRSWDELHRQENNSNLNGSYLTETFTTWKQIDAKVIRLRLVGKNHFGTDDFMLSAFEIYGAILEEKQPVQGSPDSAPEPE
jgi:hypothetical protein